MDPAALLLALRPWVRETAARVARATGADADDCEQEGLIALWLLLPRWDAAVGPVREFAGLRVKGAMRDFARSRARQDFGGHPTLLAARGGNPRVFSRDAACWVEDGEVLWDAPAAAAPEYDDGPAAELPALLRGWGVALRGHERDMLVLYFADGLTMRAVGLRLGVSESRVSQLLTRILADARAKLQAS